MARRLMRLAASFAVLVIVLSVVAAVGWYARVGVSGDAAVLPVGQPLAVETLPVRWESGYEIQRRFVGRVEARRSSDLGFEIAGMVSEVLVQEGQAVAKGQPIARLDTKRLFAREAELVAQRDQARADYELADLTRQRTLGSATRGAATEQERDEARLGYASAKAALSRAEAAVQSIGVELGKAEIASPFDAVVAERLVDEGRVLSAGTPVARLLERDRPEVRVGVGGELIDKVTVGQTLEVSIRDRSLTGQVTAVLPTRDTRARAVDVLIALDIELNGIRAGDLARIDIPRAIEARGFWVPTQALTEGVRGLWSVYLLDSSESSAGQAVLKRVDVELLHAEGDRSYVRGAVDDGAALLAGGLHRVAPGMVVSAADLVDDADRHGATDDGRAKP